jgi:hyperosmotically inducible protein
VKRDTVRNRLLNILLAFVLIAPLVAWSAGPAVALDLNPFSEIKSAVEAPVEDRSSDDIATDLRIKAAITADVIDAMGTDVISLSADVYEQDVMLSGSVDQEEQKNRPKS